MKLLINFPLHNLNNNKKQKFYLAMNYIQVLYKM